MTEETKSFVAAAEMLPTDFAFKAASHFLKAVRKHPRFADRLFVFDGHANRPLRVNHLLDIERRAIALHAKNGELAAINLLACEMREAEAANIANDTQSTIEELYDAVAVLMRMIAVVEGKQTLGGKEAAK